MEGPVRLIEIINDNIKEIDDNDDHIVRWLELIRPYDRYCRGELRVRSVAHVSEIYAKSLQYPLVMPVGFSDTESNRDSNRDLDADSGMN